MRRPRCEPTLSTGQVATHQRLWCRPLAGRVAGNETMTRFKNGTTQPLGRPGWCHRGGLREAVFLGETLGPGRAASLVSGRF